MECKLDTEKEFKDKNKWTNELRWNTKIMKNSRKTNKERERVWERERWNEVNREREKRERIRKGKKLKIHACNTLELTNEQKIKTMQAAQKCTREKERQCMYVCRERVRERVKQGILRGCTLLNIAAHVNSYGLHSNDIQ